MATLSRHYRNFLAFHRKMRDSETWICAALLSMLMHRMGGRQLVAHQRVLIKGARNIKTAGWLQLGVDPIGFCHRYDRTYLNIRGRLEFTGAYSIGKACRIDIGPDAKVTLGRGSITADTKVVVSDRLQIGDGTLISWGCLLLDDDFHQLEYRGQKPRRTGILIGDHVWIGSNVTILKGAVIPHGCVVAAGSVVVHAFDEPNCLLGGAPARVLRREVSWN